MLEIIRGVFVYVIVVIVACVIGYFILYPFIAEFLNKRQKVNYNFIVLKRKFKELGHPRGPKKTKIESNRLLHRIAMRIEKMFKHIQHAKNLS